MARRKNRYGLKQDDRGTWKCDFHVAGQRVQRSCFTSDRAAAEEWCSQVEARLWRERQLGEAPALKWEEGVALWVRAKRADGKRDLANDLDKARLVGTKLDGLFIHTLTDLQVDTVLDGFTAERGWSNGTRNRHRGFVLAVVNYLRKKGFRAPTLALEKRKEPKDRIRWITKDEAVLLLAELPLHCRRMAHAALLTGLRQANVTGLQAKNVDLGRRIAWVLPENAKGDKVIPIPLSEEAVALLIEARDCPKHGFQAQRAQNEGNKFFFTYFGRPIEEPANTAWLSALVRADIDDFTWHDMRHTWASWHVMGFFSPTGESTPLPVLQKLGGWADIRMVMKYAHLAPDYNAKFVGNAGLTQQPIPVAPIELVRAA